MAENMLRKADALQEAFPVSGRCPSGAAGRCLEGSRLSRRLGVPKVYAFLGSAC